MNNLLLFIHLVSIEWFLSDFSCTRTFESSNSHTFSLLPPSSSLLEPHQARSMALVCAACWLSSDVLWRASSCFLDQSLTRWVFDQHVEFMSLCLLSFHFFFDRSKYRFDQRVTEWHFQLFLDALLCTRSFERAVRMLVWWVFRKCRVCQISLLDVTKILVDDLSASL